MPENTRDDRPTIFPFIRYVDAPAAIDWLEAAFGFQRLTVVPNPDGTIAHAVLSFGAGVVMLGTLRDDFLHMKDPRDVGGVTQGLYVYVADVDAHCARARAVGAEITRPLEDMDYGSREYSARDPEGHAWSFGTYRPASTTGETAAAGASVGH